MKKIIIFTTLLFAACATESSPVTIQPEPQQMVCEEASPKVIKEVVYLQRPTEKTATKPKSQNSIPGLPDGFSETDRFEDMAEACLTLSKEIAPKKFRRVIWEWCEHRSWASSRNRIVRSKIDGSQIHDRDRFVAWKFYSAGIRRGTIDPESCEYHQIDKSIRHSSKELYWLKREKNETFPNWPFSSPKMTEKKRGQWLTHSHDMERFSSRGPHDNHLSLAAEYVPGCWAPEAMDRFDIAATITIKRSVAICEKHGCRTKRDIKKHW
jgi:hypothetical protein